jgi:hypothetical protein
LINPLITNWSHDQYSYAEGGGIMQNSMTVAYETVKYYSGAVGDPRNGGDANIIGFADPAHYDKTTSPIARPGSTTTVFGQGGLLETGAGIIGDLQSGSVLGLIGAVQKGARLNQTYKNKDISSIARSEARTLGKNVLVQGLPDATKAVSNKADGWLFPRAQAERNQATKQANEAATQRQNPGAI